MVSSERKPPLPELQSSTGWSRSGRSMLVRYPQDRSHESIGIFLPYRTLTKDFTVVARITPPLFVGLAGWAFLGDRLKPLAVAGLVPPWAAALGMSASSLLVTVNASRIARWPSSSS